MIAKMRLLHTKHNFARDMFKCTLHCLVNDYKLAKFATNLQNYQLCIRETSESQTKLCTYLKSEWFSIIVVKQMDLYRNYITFTVHFA